MVSMLLGNPMSGVLEDKEDKKEGEDEEDPEEIEARREAEEKRNEKYRKIEEERENMRQGIRDKYHIQKKEVPVEDPGLEGRLGRKKTDGTDDPNNPNGNGGAGFPKNLEDLKARVTELPGTVMTSVTDAKDKCQLQ